MKARLPRWAASMPCSRRTSRSSPPSRRRTASTPAATAPRAPTATACWRGRRARRSSARARCTGPTRSTSRRCSECAALLVGTHDFTAFTPTDTYHVRFERDVYAAYWRARDGGVLEFWIEADTFMRHMNRMLVGTMLEVARGRLLGGRLRAAARGRAARGGRPDRARARAVLRRRRLPRRAAAQPSGLSAAGSPSARSRGPPAPTVVGIASDLVAAGRHVGRARGSPRARPHSALGRLPRRARQHVLDPADLRPGISSVASTAFVVERAAACSSVGPSVNPSRRRISRRAALVTPSLLVHWILSSFRACV